MVRKKTTCIVLFLFFLKIAVRPVVAAMLIETPSQALASVFFHFTHKKPHGKMQIRLADVAKKRTKAGAKPGSSKALLNFKTSSMVIQSIHFPQRCGRFPFSREPDPLVHPPA
jgi:hypothetical protein